MDKRVEDFKNQIGLENPVSPDELANIVASAIKDRARIFYFTWKTIQELYPDVDADRIMAEASRKFGEYKSSGLGEVKNAEDALLKQTSKAGMLAFDQEITDLSPSFSQKLIKRCPHIEAFDELGCTKEEKIKLCTELLMPGDYGILKPFPNIILEFPKNLAADDVCIMCTKTKED